MTVKENIGAMLNYIRFSTRKGENKTLIEIRTEKDCRLDAVIESVSYPFFECAYSLTAEHGEEWLLRIEDLHMEAWKDIYMPKDILPDEDTENWEVAYCDRRRRNILYPSLVRPCRRSEPPCKASLPVSGSHPGDHYRHGRKRSFCSR